ncbi:hypothetical protein QJQ45_001973 [Haematococcus lacustris]|nr:hypothetical protein QJQ45_001973 [Haematococcus lacustris]
MPTSFPSHITPAAQASQQPRRRSRDLLPHAAAHGSAPQPGSLANMRLVSNASELPSSHSATGVSAANESYGAGRASAQRDPKLGKAQQTTTDLPSEPVNTQTLSRAYLWRLCCIKLLHGMHFLVFALDRAPRQQAALNLLALWPTSPSTMVGIAIAVVLLAHFLFAALGGARYVRHRRLANCISW